MSAGASCPPAPARPDPVVRSRRHWLAAAPLGLTALALQPSPLWAATAAPALGDPVLWPTVTLLDGRVFGAEQWGAAATLVVFFSTTCPFCQRHNRHVEKLLRSTRGQPLQVIGVAQDRSEPPVRDYLARQGYSFAVTLDERALHQALSPRKVIPLTCVVDRSGRLREVIPGEMFEEDVMELARWARA